MLRISRTVFLTSAVLWTSAAAQTAGDDDRTPINTILVTGTRIEQTTAEAGSTVRVIDAAEIEARGFSHALDAIAGAPGVIIN